MTREEALQAIKAKMDYYESDKRLRGAIETLVPELRESEDEKFRKYILQVCKECVETNDKGLELSMSTTKKLLAYLEKQKENPKSADSFTDDIIEIRSFQRGMEEGRRLEKQKEQNKCPEFCSGHCVGCERNEQKDYRKLYEDIAKSEWFKQNYVGKSLGCDEEQKPIQTSEEKEYIRTLKSLISDFIRDKQPEDVAFYQKMYDWLEGRHIEQKPAGWKPQPESLEALMYAIEGKWNMIPPTSYLSRRLEDLYEGLVNTFNVNETLLAELPKTAYTAEDIEELRELKHKIEASMEQKPAEWSEEAEMYLSQAIETLEHENHLILADKLKSLRPSWGPSEDEERLINTSISFLKDFADKGYENAVECIDWLKSKLNGNTCK